MTKRKTTQQPPQDMPDQYTGIGGEYIRDPATGHRVPLAEWQRQHPDPIDSTDSDIRED